MKPESFTETSVTIYQYTRRHIPQECTHRQQCFVGRDSSNLILIRYRCVPKHYLKFSVFVKINGFCLYHDFVCRDDEAGVFSVLSIYFWPPAFLIVQSRPTRRLRTCEISLKAAYRLNTFMSVYSSPVGLANT